MAANFTPKRTEIARKMVDAATAIVDGIEYLKTVPALLAETGASFEDADPQATPPEPGDFAGTDYQHVDAYGLHVLRDAASGGHLETALATAVGQGGPQLGAILRRVKRG